MPSVPAAADPVDRPDWIHRLDELHLLVHPIAARSGDRLFTEGAPMVPMTLLRSKALPTGVLALAYAPVRAEA